MAVTVDNPVAAELLADTPAGSAPARPAPRTSTPSDAPSFVGHAPGSDPWCGIGPKVVAEALKVLGRGGAGRERTAYDVGASRWRGRELLPEPCWRSCGGRRDPLGAVGDPGGRRACRARAALRLRFELAHHFDLRPARLFDGVSSPLADPGEIDMSASARARRAPTWATAACCARTPPRRSPPRFSLNTAFGVEPVVGFAFERAVAVRAGT